MRNWFSRTSGPERRRVPSALDPRPVPHGLRRSDDHAERSPSTWAWSDGCAADDASAETAPASATPGLTGSWRMPIRRGATTTRTRPITSDESASTGTVRAPQRTATEYSVPSTATTTYAARAVRLRDATIPPPATNSSATALGTYPWWIMWTARAAPAPITHNWPSTSGSSTSEPARRTPKAVKYDPGTPWTVSGGEAEVRTRYPE